MHILGQVCVETIGDSANTLLSVVNNLLNLTILERDNTLAAGPSQYRSLCVVQVTSDMQPQADARASLTRLAVLQCRSWRLLR